MKKLLLLFFALTYFMALAQANKGLVKGKVIDKTTKEPLPYVNIVIKDASEKILTGGITNDKGNFEIKDIVVGKQTIEFQFIGYETLIKNIDLTQNSKLNLGTVSIAESSNLMDEVTLVTEVSTVEQKVDRKVINVGKDLTSAGTTASEMLNNVQSVSVDQQTGNISLRGNENVRILIDGKPSNMSAAQLLKQIPSSSIKQVELITNPSAKYNPEGMSGMINIILHKNANQGFNAHVNAGVTHGENTRYNGSFNMNYKTGKVNFYSNYGLNMGKSHNFGHVNRTETPTSRQEFVFDNDPKSHLLKLGADVYINDRNTLSLYTTQNFNESYNDGFTKVWLADSLITNTPNFSDTETRSQVYNAHYKHIFNESGDHNLEIEANFSSSKNPENADYRDLVDPTNLSKTFTNDITNNRENILFNVDYTKALNKTSKIELGGEIRLDDTENKNITTQENFQNSSFEYNRSIYSLYGTYSKKMDKLSILLGSRFESFTAEGNFERGTESAPYKR